jgi:protein-serine/threonine kinase
MSTPDAHTPKSQCIQGSSHDVYSNAQEDASAQGRHAKTDIMNQQAAKANAEAGVAYPTVTDAAYTIPTIFHSNTIAPSPPPNRASPPPNNHSNLTPLDTSARNPASDTQGQQPSPLSAGLRIKTDIIPNYTITAASAHSAAISSTDSMKSQSTSKNIPIQPVKRTPSIKNILASSIGSNSGFGSTPNSALSSPMLNALVDVTPLPSPLLSADSPGPWKKLGSRPVSRDMNVPSTANAALVTANGESLSSAIANQVKRRAYQGLVTNAGESGLIHAEIQQEKAAEGHTRNRSLSEYTPDAMHVPKTRQIAVSGTHAVLLDVPIERVIDTMRREPHLAVQRGLAPVPKPPTPPSSRTGGESSDSDSSLSSNRVRSHRKSRYEYFEANTRKDSKRRRWRALKVLGQGTFSKVVLATSQAPDLDDTIDEDHVFGQSMEGIVTPVQETKIDQKKLVAIKICEHGPKGGASEERVEMSLKRELEIMKSINHPSLVDLLAWSIEETRAILVLSYCPGGDLFEVASQHRDLLVPGLLRRIFSELVGAVRYLHERRIVHRDIKLESML